MDHYGTTKDHYGTTKDHYGTTMDPLLSSSSLSFLCAPFSFLSCRWRCLLCDSPCAYGFSSSAGLDCTERTLSYLLGEVARDPLPCCGWLPHRTKRR